MSHRALQRIIGVTVMDPDFCGKLLNGERRTLLAEFDLTGEERRVLTTIETSSLQEFAARLEGWLQAQENGEGSLPVPRSSGGMLQRHGYGRLTTECP